MVKLMVNDGLMFQWWILNHAGSASRQASSLLRNLRLHTSETQLVSTIGCRKDAQSFKGTETANTRRGWSLAEDGFSGLSSDIFWLGLGTWYPRSNQVASWCPVFGVTEISFQAFRAAMPCTPSTDIAKSFGEGIWAAPWEDIAGGSVIEVPRATTGHLRKVLWWQAIGPQ